MNKKQPSMGIFKWYDTKPMCISMISLCIFLIILFAIDIVAHGKWILSVYIVFYAALGWGRLKQLRRLNGENGGA